MGEDSNYEYNVQDIYGGIKKTGIECLVCGKSDWTVLGDPTKYDVAKENPDVDIDEPECEVIKLQCKHCGFIMEYNAKYFYDDSLRKVLRKKIRGRNLV